MPGYAKIGDWVLEHMNGKDIKSSTQRVLLFGNVECFHVIQSPTIMS